MILLSVFIITNIVIFCSYAIIAYFVVPSLNVTYKITKYSGFAFFLTCALTHLDLAWHAMFGIVLDRAEFISWHMLGIHIPQAIAVSVFTYSLYKEVGKAKNSFMLRSYPELINQLLSNLDSMRPHIIEEHIKLLNESYKNLEAIKTTLKATMDGTDSNEQTDHKGHRQD